MAELKRLRKMKQIFNISDRDVETMERDYRPAPTTGRIGLYGLSADAVDFLGDDVEYEKYADLMVRQNDWANFAKYTKPDGSVVYEEIQTELHSNLGPHYYTALQTPDGEWIEETLWDDEEMTKATEQFIERFTESNSVFKPESVELIDRREDHLVRKQV